LRSAKPLAAKTAPSPARPPAQPSAGSAPSTAAPKEEVIEVPAEDMDLAGLAELAKKIVERKPT
jgi:hypothetical protein